VDQSHPQTDCVPCMTLNARLRYAECFLSRNRVNQGASHIMGECSRKVDNVGGSRAVRWQPSGSLRSSSGEETIGRWPVWGAVTSWVSARRAAAQSADELLS